MLTWSIWSPYYGNLNQTLAQFLGNRNKVLSTDALSVLLKLQIPVDPVGVLSQGRQ